MAVNKTSKVPQSLLNGKLNIDKFEDEDIIHQPLGVVFRGNNKNGKMTKFLFQICDLERYTNSQYTNLLIRMNNCKRNEVEDKVEIRKMIMWYMDVCNVLLQTLKLMA